MSHPKFGPRQHLKRGYSLVEVLLALGLMGALSLQLASQMGQASKLSRYATDQEDMNQFMTELGLALGASSGACAANLVNLMQSTFEPAPLRKELPVPVLLELKRVHYSVAGKERPLAAPGQKIDSGNTEVSRLAFQLDRELQQDSHFMGSLKVTFRKNGSFIGAKEVTRSIPLRLFAQPLPNESLQVVDCHIGNDVGCRFHLRPISGGPGTQPGETGNCSLVTPPGATNPNEIQCSGEQGFGWRFSVALCRTCDDGSTQCYDEPREILTVDQFERD